MTSETTVQTYLDLHRNTLEEDEIEIEWLPSETTAPQWCVTLRGDKHIFARIARNLLDNAIKYGGDSALIKIESYIGTDHRWDLRISNPGQLTPEEDELKFVARAKRVIHEETKSMSAHEYNKQAQKGAHVGLAASCICARAQNAKLSVNNIKDEDRVEARLIWPLAGLMEKSHD